MRTVLNLFDSCFSHVRKQDGIYSAILGQIPKNIKYVHGLKSWEGITIFTEHNVISGIHKTVTSKYKIGWLIESSVISGINFNHVANVIQDYDYILTFDEKILENFPDKTILIPLAGSWIQEDSIKLHQKTKSISYIMSHKNQTDGHKLRHTVLKEIHGKYNIDVYGRGINNIEKKEFALNDYKYSLVIENTRQKNYFTEKLIDCFVTGTVPIYWGCPNINEFFDINGMIIFKDVNELNNILRYAININVNSDYIQQNFNESLKYVTIEDFIMEKLNKTLYNTKKDKYGLEFDG